MMESIVLHVIGLGLGFAAMAFFSISLNEFVENDRNHDWFTRTLGAAAILAQIAASVLHGVA